MNVNGNGKMIAVFGGSRVESNTPEYAQAYAVGKLLAGAGFTLLNGGYTGTMEASARGAKENGGRVIGVTSPIFTAQSPNAYLDEEIPAHTLYTRIEAMVTRADGFIVLKGSMGTLAELMIVWNLAKIDAGFGKPIVLLGAHWGEVMRTLREHLAVSQAEASLLHLVGDPQEAVALLAGYVLPHLER